MLSLFDAKFGKRDALDDTVFSLTVDSVGVMRIRRQPAGKDGTVEVLQLGFFRHLVVKCLDRWETFRGEDSCCLNV